MLCLENNHFQTLKFHGVNVETPDQTHNQKKKIEKQRPSQRCCFIYNSTQIGVFWRVFNSTGFRSNRCCRLSEPHRSTLHHPFLLHRCNGLLSDHHGLDILADIPADILLLRHLLDSTVGCWRIRRSDWPSACRDLRKLWQPKKDLISNLLSLLWFKVFTLIAVLECVTF